MKNKTKTLIAAAIIVTILSILFLPKVFSGEDKQNPVIYSNKGSMGIPVTAHITRYETLDNNVYSTGTVLSGEEIEVRSEISGKITGIMFEEGSFVEKGDLLVKINDSELQAQLKKAESKVKLVESKEYRQRILVENKMVSEEEYENTLNELETSRAELQLIQAQIEKTEIRAPFSGMIGLRSVSEGSFITNSTVIARLQNLDRLKIEFSIPQKYASMVQVGDQAEFRISGNDVSYSASVYALEPKIDPSTRTLRIRAICSRYYKNLFPGAFVDVELKLKKIENAVLVPSVSIVPQLKGQIVYLYRDGIVAPQHVETGIRFENSVQITSGLSEKDTVITSGILQIRPGARVKITGFN